MSSIQLFLPKYRVALSVLRREEGWREGCESIDLDLLAPRFPGLAGLAEARR